MYILLHFYTILLHAWEQNRGTVAIVFGTFYPDPQRKLPGSLVS